MRMARPLNAAQQLLGLRSNPICRGNGELGAGLLVWRYAASPTPLSRDYAIRIVFRQGRWPDVFVDQPDLVALAGGRRPPHVYRIEPLELCLHLPRIREWRPEMRLDQTVVPWTALWLFHFEQWLMTGEWEGGGEHPAPRPRTRRETRLREAGDRSAWRSAA